MGKHPDLLCCDYARRKPPRPCGSCADGGYIVEKVIGNHRDEACFEGLLEICGLPCHLCPPLSLCGIDVIQIDPCCGADPCAGCCVPAGQRLQLTLLCFVVDGRGCRAEGTAKIEITIPMRRNREMIGLNIRRGAQVVATSACFCPPCSFSICLSICVQTIVSRCEMIGQRPLCPPPCPDLPLYPPPARRTIHGTRYEHFMD